MFLIIGLGNPGDDYAHTRHTVGFDVVDALATFCVGAGRRPRPSFRISRTLHAEVLECAIGDKRAILAKPTTFMNESGTAAAALIREFGIHHSAFCICHDDLDLPLGTLRLSDGGSSGGHKGVQSIIDALGTKDFLRLRIGIGPNATSDGIRIPAEDFVLQRFGKTERPQLAAAVAKAVDVLATLVREGVEAAHKRAS